MTNYASVADIQGEMKNITISTTSAVKTADVENFLEQETALINIKIGNRYSLPIDISATDSLLLLKKIEIDFVVCRIDKILNLKKDQVIPNKGVVQVSNYQTACKKSMEMLDQISSGKIELPGVDPISTNSGMESYNSVNSIDPTFNTSGNQW